MLSGFWKSLAKYYPFMVFFYLIFPTAVLAVPLIYYNALPENALKKLLTSKQRHELLDTNITHVLIPNLFNYNTSIKVENQYKLLPQITVVWLCLAGVAFVLVLLAMMIDACTLVNKCCKKRNQFFRTVCCNIMFTHFNLMRVVLVAFYLPSMMINFGWCYAMYTYELENSGIRDVLLESLLTENRDLAWSKAQYTFECCGVDSYKDYGPHFTPDDSCCKTVFPKCANNALKNSTVASNLHQKGCIDFIRRRLMMQREFITAPFRIICLGSLFFLLLAWVPMAHYIKLHLKKPALTTEYIEKSTDHTENLDEESDGNETIETDDEDDEPILTDNLDSNSEDALLENESNDSNIIIDEVQIHMDNVVGNIEENIFQNDDEQLLVS